MAAASLLGCHDTNARDGGKNPRQKGGNVTEANTEDTRVIVDIENLWLVMAVDPVLIAERVSEIISEGKMGDLPVKMYGLVESSRENVIMRLAVDHPKMQIISISLLSDLLELTS